MKRLCSLIFAIVMLTACSQVPYHQPVTEVARAVRISHQELAKIAPKADAEARQAFLQLYHASPTARASLRLNDKGCTQKAVRAGASCYAMMDVPGTNGLVIRAGNDLIHAVTLTRQLALYALWLKKIAAADNCAAAGKASQAAFAQSVKLYELAGEKDLPASVKLAATPLRFGVCVYLERRKLEALQEATGLADDAVQAASRHLVQALRARAFSSASLIRAELAALELELLPDNDPAARDKAAARYIKKVAELDRALKYGAGLSAVAEGLGPSHRALTEALTRNDPNFTKVYQAAQNLRTGMGLLRRAFELETDK